MAEKALEVLIECTMPYSTGNILRGGARSDLPLEWHVPSDYSTRIDVFRHMVAVHPEKAKRQEPYFKRMLKGMHDFYDFNPKDFSERELMSIFSRDDGAESLRFMALGKALGLWERSRSANGEIRAISRSRSKRKA